MKSKLSKLSLMVGFSSFSIIVLQVVVAQALSFSHQVSNAILVLPFSFLGTTVGILLGSLMQKKLMLPWIYIFSSVVFGLSAVVYLHLDFVESPIALVFVLFFSVGLNLGATFYQASSDDNNIQRLYFWDLLGAALGSVFIIFLPYLRVEGSFLLLTLCFTAAGLIAGWQTSWYVRFIGVTTFILFSVLLTLQFTTHRFLLVKASQGEIQPSFFSSELQTNGSACVRSNACDFIDSRWDLTAAVDTLRDKRDGKIYLYYNNERFTKVSDGADLGVFSGPSPFPFPKTKATLVIGPGGGGEIFEAIQLGAEEVTAVEINKGTIELMTGPLLSASAGIYSKAIVIHSDGRTFLSRSNQTFDLIRLNYVDLHTNSGFGNVFHENYLYTKDAMSSMLDHLSDEGVIAITKGVPMAWDKPRVEVLRMTRGLAVALREIGQDPTKNILIFESSRLDLKVPLSFTILAGRRPFGAETLKKMSLFKSADQQLLRIIYPDVYPVSERFIEEGYQPNSFAIDQMKKAIEGSLEDGQERYLKVPTDDWPFIYTENEDSLLSNSVAKFLLFGVSLALILALLIFKMEVYGLKEVKNKIKQNLWAGGALGLCYGFLEVSLFQAFNLFVGLPLLTFVGLVTSLILGGAIAAKISNKLSNNQLYVVTIFMPLYFYLLIYFIRPVLQDQRIMNVGLRALILAIVIFPVGISSSVLFPRLLKNVHECGSRWASLMLGYNLIGCSIGTWLAMVMAIKYGFYKVQILIFFIYVLLVLMLLINNINSKKLN